MPTLCLSFRRLSCAAALTSRHYFPRVPCACGTNAFLAHDHSPRTWHAARIAVQTIMQTGTASHKRKICELYVMITYLINPLDPERHPHLSKLARSWPLTFGTCLRKLPTSTVLSAGVVAGVMHVTQKLVKFKAGVSSSVYLYTPTCKIRDLKCVPTPQDSNLCSTHAVITGSLCSFR